MFCSHERKGISTFFLILSFKLINSDLKLFLNFSGLGCMPLKIESFLSDQMHQLTRTKRSMKKGKFNCNLNSSIARKILLSWEGWKCRMFQHAKEKGQDRKRCSSIFLSFLLIGEFRWLLELYNTIAHRASSLVLDSTSTLEISCGCWTPIDWVC